MKMECHVVRDLLPSYAEDLISEETKRDIIQHLGECEECQKVYESFASKTDKAENRRFLIKTRDLVLSKKAFVAVILLFVALKFFMDYAMVSNLRSYEGEFYILLVSGVIWFTYKDRINMSVKPVKTVWLLHLVIILLSCVSVVVIYMLMSANRVQLESLLTQFGMELGFYLSTALRFEILLFLVISVYGFYAYARGTKQCYSLISHGMGGAVLIYGVLKVLTSLDLSLNHADQVLAIIGYTVLPYVVGLVPVVLSVLADKVKRKEVFS